MAKSKVISSKSGFSVNGGSKGMFGKQYAGPQKSGTTATGSKTGSGGKYAKGGSTKMFGKQRAMPAGKC